MVAGVHPHDADRCGGLWDALLEVVNEGLPVAIGETGLDHFYDHSSPEVQRRSFRRHVELALERDLPLVLHVREAHREALALLDDYRRDGWTGVVHCFTGGPAEAEDWLARGFHLSIPGVVTFPARGALADAVPRIPEDRLLVETDSPYLTPAPWRGRRNEPARVVWTAQEIAALREEEYEDLVRTTIRNTSKLFCIPFISPLDIPEKLTIISSPLVMETGKHQWEEREMKMEKISLVEFEQILTTGSKRAPYGQNQSLLRKAETEPVKLTFETDKKAISKQTALYVVRRKLDAQVRIVRKKNVLYIGPGEYVPSNRTAK